MKNTLFVGNVFLKFDELVSTNDYLSAMVHQSPPPEGTLVVAQQQSKGKGQQGTSWFTGSGQNTAMSFFFRPTFVHPSLHFLLTQCFALGVLDALKEFKKEGFSLKWPNDLYFEDKKIGGMLIETAIQGQRFSHCIVGIGLNVNQAEFPPELPNPTSLSQITKRTIEKKVLIEAICQCIEQRYLQLRRGAVATIQSDYTAALYLFDKKSPFLDIKTQKTFWASIRGVDEQGLLCLENADGQAVKYGIKTIRFL